MGICGMEMVRSRTGSPKGIGFMRDDEPVANRTILPPITPVGLSYEAFFLPVV